MIRTGACLVFMREASAGRPANAAKYLQVSPVMYVLPAALPRRLGRVSPESCGRRSKPGTGLTKRKHGKFGLEDWRAVQTRLSKSTAIILRVSMEGMHAIEGRPRCHRL